MKNNLLKKVSFIGSVSAISLMAISCGAAQNTAKIQSSSIDANGVLKDEFSLGSSKSFNLSWQKIEGAKSYAVVMVDKDAFQTVGTAFFHWVVGNIPATQTSLEVDASVKNSNLLQFENSTSKKTSNKNVVPGAFKTDKSDAYFGPYPPDADHLYEVRVIGLNAENAFADLDKTKPLFFSDFENAIAGKVVGSHTLYMVGKKVENPTTANATLVASTNTTNNFFKNGTKVTPIQNIKVDDGDVLDKKYVANLATTANAKYTRPDADKSPKISFNKVEGAKSYVVMLNNSNQLKAWGVAIANWNVVGIAQPTEGNVVTIEKNATGTEAIKEGVNSYWKTGYNFKNILPENILNVSETIGQGFGLATHDAETDTTGFYTLFVYATDLEPSELAAGLNQGQILAKLRNHVIGYGQKPMKLSV